MNCPKANETMAAYMEHDAARADRKLFVHNLGELMSQTREGIVGAYLDDNDQVHVQYKHDYEVTVNVNMDSYMAIIRDVAKGVKL